MAHRNDLTCNRGSVGQSEGLSIPRSSVRFRLKPDTPNSHEFELHRPSNKGTKLLLKVIKAIIIINAGRLGAGFISVCLETRWLGQKRSFYVPEPPCIVLLTDSAITTKLF